MPVGTTFIFDMDGVLWDSWTAHEAAYRETLATVGITDFDYARWSGMRTDAVMAAILNRCGLDGDAAGLTRMKRSRALARLASHPPVAPAAHKVLEAAARRGPIGLATSASPAALNLFLEALGAIDPFDAVVGGSDVQNAKPAPDIYLEAAHRLDCEPADCIVVEDSTNGVIAGRNAGMRTIGLATYVLPSDLSNAGADWVLPGLSDLPAWMDDHVPIANPA